MKDFRIAVILNGAEGMDWYENFSNLLKIKHGLENNDQQSVIYRNLQNPNNEKNTLSRVVMYLTGYSYAYLLESVFRELLAEIKIAVNSNKVAKDGKVIISLFGFSDGASLARHFGVEYIKQYLIDSLPSELKEAGIKIELDAEYLFESMHLPTPSKVSIFSRWSSLSYPAHGSYYKSDIPPGTKCYHALSLDDIDKANSPLRVDQSSGVVEEVWFAGDQLDIGGGHFPPSFAAPVASDDALRYMTLRAMQNGLQFKPDYFDQIKMSTHDQTVRSIHFTGADLLPAKLRQVRSVYVQKGSRVSDAQPLVHESVLHRMSVEQKPDYEPSALLPLLGAELGVVTKSGDRASARFEDKPATPITPRFSQHKIKAKPCKSDLALNDDDKLINRTSRIRIKSK